MKVKVKTRRTVNYLLFVWITGNKLIPLFVFFLTPGDKPVFPGKQILQATADADKHKLGH